MPDHYRTNFTIQSEKTQGLELLDEVEDIVRDWALEKFGQSLGDEPTGVWEHEKDDSLIQIEGGRTDDDESGYWILILQHSDADVDTFRWHSQIRLSTTGDEVEIGVEVYTILQGTDGEFEVVPAKKINANTGPPEVLATLVTSFDCRIEGERLSVEAERITEDNSWVFVEESIFDPNRRMPLVVVSENRLGGSFISADHLQSHLLGLAKVATYDHKTAQAVHEWLGENLECRNGTIRMYRPGCIPEDGSSRNWYWTWHGLNEKLITPGTNAVLLGLDQELGHSGWAEVLLRIESECEDHLIPSTGSRQYDLIRFQVLQERHQHVIEQLQEKQQNEAETTDNKAILEELTNTLAEYERQMADYQSRLDRQSSEYERQIDELRSENEELHDKVDQLNLALYNHEPDGEMEGEDEQPSKFDTIHHVVEHAKQYDGLRFFPRAVELARASGFRRPNDLHEAFKALNDCHVMRRDDTLGKGVEEWLKKRGLDYAPFESDITMGKYGKERMYVLRAADRAAFSRAMEEAKTIKGRPVCIVTETDRRQRVAGYESWWDVPVAEVSESESVRAARAVYDDYKKRESYYQ